MPPSGGGAPMGAPGCPGPAAGGAAPAGFSRNSPIRRCPQASQLSGGLGRRSSAPQFTHTKVFSIDSRPFWVQQAVTRF